MLPSPHLWSTPLNRPVRAVGVLYPTARPEDFEALLPLEMWVNVRRAAGMADQFEVCLWGAQRHLPRVQEAARAWGLRVDKWHHLSHSTDDCRVAMDWINSRGGGPWVTGTNINWWTDGGPRPILKFLIAMGYRLPDMLAGSHGWRLVRIRDTAQSGALRRGPTPWLHPRRALFDGWATGRHSLREWRPARGAVGARLLALLPPRGRIEPDVLARLDVRLRVLYRIRNAPRQPPGDLPRAALVELANALLTLQALPIVWRWLIEAQRRADSGEAVDFSLPTLLGLHPISGLRIIP